MRPRRRRRGYIERTCTAGGCWVGGPPGPGRAGTGSILLLHASRRPEVTTLLGHVTGHLPCGSPHPPWKGNHHYEPSGSWLGLKFRLKRLLYRDTVGVIRLRLGLLGLQFR